MILLVHLRLFLGRFAAVFDSEGCFAAVLGNAGALQCRGDSA
jgi:hypothetical protein